MVNFKIVFDKVILKQLHKIGKDGNLRPLFSKMFDKLEELGPVAGKLLDLKLSIYEIKMKRPPIRLYFKYQKTTNEIYVFEYEMKTSPEKQQWTIERVRQKALES